MSDYRCYFFGFTTAFGNAANAIEAGESFFAITDEEAQLRAESVRRRDNHPLRGFELWEGNRLVCRHSAEFGRTGSLKESV